MSAARRKVRPLASHEAWPVFAAGLMLGAFFAQILPFFDGTISELDERGLLPAGIAYMVGLALLGWLLVWAITYVMRRAAMSAKAPRWFVLGMEPHPRY